MRSLNIGKFVAKLPIVQGGMGVGISLSGLASAVASQGGVGVISAAGTGLLATHPSGNYLEDSITVLKEEIRRAQALTNGILGVNIMVALSNFSDLVKASIEEGIDVIFAGAGLPLDLPKYLEGTTFHTKIVPIVSSARAAGLIARKWLEKYNYAPDAIVVEGPRAGGHLGFKPQHINDPQYTLENLVVEVLAKIKPLAEKLGKSIPVIAGGGIYTGADIYRFLKLGADGVQMATRFVTTEECDASIDFKMAYINANKEDIGIIKSPVGMPGRAIVNTFIAEVNSGKRQPYQCPYHCIITCDSKRSPYCIALALLNAQKGKLKRGFAFAGDNAYKANEIISVKTLIERIKEEYQEAVKN